MAATDATAIPVKNQAYRVTFPILDSDGDLVPGAAGLDSEVSKDGGTFTDCTNEATEIATASGLYFLDLTATEMNADTVALIIKTSTSGGKTTVIVLYPAEDADVRVNVRNWLGSAPNALLSGRVDSNVGAMASSVLTAAATAADYLAEVNAEVDTALVDARLDELLAADSDIDGAAPPTVGSVFHELMSKSTGSFTFDQTTDSLEAVRDKEADIETDTQDIQTRLPAALVSGRIDASVGAVAANAINDAGVAADMDHYAAKVWVIKEGTTADHYAVAFYKNGQRVTSGVTSPTIQVIKGSDGTDLIASTALTEIGSTHRFKKDEATNKMVAGAIYFAVVNATIDGFTRSWDQQIGRDAA